MAGRRAPIPIYGIAPALDQARRCWEAFDTSSWDDLPEMPPENVYELAPETDMDTESPRQIELVVAEIVSTGALLATFTAIEFVALQARLLVADIV